MEIRVFAIEKEWSHTQKFDMFAILFKSKFFFKKTYVKCLFWEKWWFGGFQKEKLGGVGGCGEGNKKKNMFTKGMSGLWKK